MIHAARLAWRWFMPHLLGGPAIINRIISWQKSDKPKIGLGLSFMTDMAGE